MSWVRYCAPGDGGESIAAEGLDPLLVKHPLA